ncbi:MAG TPA: hypothetical protein VNA04_11270 [Thermoanaerobaculia bacterium]|nr:hypothetical protein [Thermoanaerobaculia bacterium]
MELIDDESPCTPSAAIYLVKVGYEEAALREQVKAAGGRWNREKKVWLVTGAGVSSS